MRKDNPRPGAWVSWTRLLDERGWPAHHLELHADGKFVNDFVAARTKVMNADRFDTAVPS